ncbi:MAG: AAA family ATPase [Clostridiales bacterium]|nr:AAA family ATPase [Candidatus Crickella caballi]
MLCDSLDESALGIKALVPTSRKTTYEIFKSETVRLLTYLGCIDGDFSDREVRFINEYLDTDYNIKDLRRLVDNDKEISSIETTVPVFMKIIINADNIRLQRGVPHGEATCVTMYQFFGEIGRNFIACDDKVGEKETEALTNILETMRLYYEDKDEEYKEQNKASGNEMNAGTAGGAASAAQVEVSVESSKDAAAQAQAEEEIGTLEELLEELNSLVGLEKVKKDVNSLINLAQVMKLRQERGLKQVDITLHLVFSGNPGTGKTTVARLISKLYYRIGVLSKGQLVEVDRSGLVMGYVGQTAIKTAEVLQSAVGGVLFIDEAYALTARRGDNDFGQEAVDTILKGMEDNRDDLAVIVAGYPDLMTEFINSNPGLKSRFNKYIFFDDYTPEELFAIFESQCKKNGYEADDEAKEFVKEFFKNRYDNRDDNYANARDVRNFFEKAVVEQANRLSKEEAPTDEELSTFKLCDVSAVEL